MALLPHDARPAADALFANPGSRRDLAVPPDEALDVLDEGGLAEAARSIGAWEGYAPTPLHRLAGLAAAMGVGAVLLKDEGGRFGLGSFKALGGAYAVERLVARHGAGITVTCATDGNHGRSVAWGAARAGCRCVIYIHEAVSEGRRRAIEAYGAEVRRVPGTYDDAVRKAAEDAALAGWKVVSDTSWPGYEEVPKDVMQGYAVMAEEALDQAGAAPTHIFVQGGVGGIAAAAAMRAWRRFHTRRPALVVVEPELAACLLASARARAVTSVAITEETVMAGLSCGEPSLIAWKVLEPAADWFMALPDAAAAPVMRLLAEGVGGDRPVVAGESAVAGLAGAIACAEDAAMRERLGLGPESRIMVFSTEGDTDPELYARLVGRSAEEVRAAGNR
ncbi:diaminopropionate ammonia-lyase [Geminicoccaceae bacterium 1502E]|nr:diaminopropionate ammonia-lyase [Geminicoccaceae bacterium 1502E]